MDASKLDLGGALAYGADYNPEQFDDATFARDLELMRQAQVNLVSWEFFLDATRTQRGQLPPGLARAANRPPMAGRY